ncbi:MAG: FHA domain-containing protein [Caldilineae bacterium]|nr:MAG: FHA domain-containing protein [Caldilineae bacterium]
MGRDGGGDGPTRARDNEGDHRLPMDDNLITDDLQAQTEELPQVPHRESAMLVMRHGGEAGRRWVLSRSHPIQIGRNETCDITLPDRQVSRQHARIVWREEGYYVEDLGSKNGTHVNGEEVRAPVRLEDGDEIQIALRFKLAFVDAGATAPLSLEEEAEGLRLDTETRQVWVNGQCIDPPLSLHQYRLLSALWAAGGGVVTREKIVDVVWPEASGEGVSEQAIDALVRRLRERIAEYDDSFRYIVTVRGHGFRLENR